MRYVQVALIAQAFWIWGWAVLNTLQGNGGFENIVAVTLSMQNVGIAMAIGKPRNQGGRAA